MDSSKAYAYEDVFYQPGGSLPVALDDSKKDYVVFVETKPGSWFGILESNDYDSAVRTANFWDEKVNIAFLDRKHLEWIVQRDQQMAREKEQKRIAELSIGEQFDEAMKSITADIDRNAQDAMLRLRSLV